MAPMQPPAALMSLLESVRQRASRAHARWQDSLFQRLTDRPSQYLWRALEKQKAAVRERSLLGYLELVAAGIGGGYLTGEEASPRTLLEGFLGRLPYWLARTDPAGHAQLITSIWNLAEGARREALWMEQYLLARISDLSDPLKLEAQALALLRPALEPQPQARWCGPYEVRQIPLAEALPAFLPGEISLLTPSLVRIADRRQGESVGVLLAAPGAGESACIGPMQGGHPALTPPPPPVSVSWSHDHVKVGDTVVPLPLMACEPLHTLTLPGGHLLAVLKSSQRLWVVQGP